MLNEFSKKEAPIQGLTGLGGGVPSRLFSAASGITVDQVFSATLYTGNNDGAGAEETQTITNDIDLSGEGGLVWLKKRVSGGNDQHFLYDTERGATKYLRTETSAAEGTGTDGLTQFNSDGFLLGGERNNYLNDTYISWTFRKCPKFFDIVTYTGDGTTNRNIPHNLGSVPGFITVKGRSTSFDPWYSYHRTTGNQGELRLSETDSLTTGSSRWASYTPTSSHFRGDTAAINVDGRTYVAYLFAHDEQEFGAGSDEAIIKCDEYTGTGSGDKAVNLGFEPQFVMIKRTDSSDDWYVFDSARGVVDGGTDATLHWNENGSESDYNFNAIKFTSTGFTLEGVQSDVNGNGGEYIYIAIRAES